MRYCVLFMFITLLFAGCKKEEQATVKGKIINSAGKNLKFEELEQYFTRKADSLVVKSNEKFSFKAKLKIPNFFQLVYDSTKMITLLLEPGEKVYLSANLDDLVNTLEIKGSRGSALLNELQKRLNIMQKSLDSVAEIYKNTFDEKIKERLSAEYNNIIENHKKYSIKFILENMGSMVSYSALYQQYDDGKYIFNSVRDLQYYKLVTDSLTKKYSRSKHIIALKENTQNMLNTYRNQQILSLVSDDDFHLPDIELPDIDNKTVKLSSLKGKYLLLNFWASWDQQSIQNNINLKDTYKKYHEKGFEIYSVSFDNSVSSFKRAVNFDALPWINVVDTLYPNSPVIGFYNVQEIPSNYLISKDFENILGKNLTPGQLNKKLSELLN